jgi:hypothetical protein
VTDLDILDVSDPQAVLALARETDPLGVLSVYVTADLGEDPGLRAVAIDVENRLRELQRRIASEGPRERARRLDQTIERLAPELRRLTSPHEHGRGRALFAPLGEERAVWLAAQLPVPTRVVLDDGPFIHPLLELLERGRPAGVVLASADEAQILDWRLGELELLERLEPEVFEAPHERSGPVGSAPTAGAGSPMLEQRAARERELAARFAGEVAAAASRLAGERGWEDVLVSAGERLTDQLADAFPQPLRESAIRDRRVLLHLETDRLARAVTERLEAGRAEAASRLVGQAAERALGAGRVALGLSEVVGALNERRVLHLLYDPEIRYQGSVGADGLLYAGDESGPAGAEQVPEPRLTERLVERALATGARITPLSPATSGGLREAGGVAALLRW